MQTEKTQLMINDERYMIRSADLKAMFVNVNKREHTKKAYIKRMTSTFNVGSMRLMLAIIKYSLHVFFISIGIMIHNWHFKNIGSIPSVTVS